MLPTTRPRVLVAGVLVCALVALGRTSANEGATSSAEKWWSFRPVSQVEVPPVQREEWCRNDIDRFVLARLEGEKLAPAPDADKLTLLRRATVSLTGLPPTLNETKEFLADESPEALKRLVDRLLASPHFGERFGRHWLDVARYADSTGGGRSMLYGSSWRYRDYVIESFNKDKPYDQFVKEQIAGDLLPADNYRQQGEQLVATGFLALGPNNYELQDKEQLRMDVVDEQIDTMGRAMLGMTLGCARCHDHMFDPVPTRDYYALAGIFRSTRTMTHANVSNWIKRPLPLSPEQQQALDEYNELVAAQQALIKEAEQALARITEQLPILTKDDIDAQLKGRWSTGNSVVPFTGEAYRYTSGEGEARYHFKLAEPGRYEVRVSYTPHANRSPKVEVRVHHTKGDARKYVDQREAPPLPGNFAPIGQYEFAESCEVVIRGMAKGNVVVDAVQLVPLEPNGVDDPTGGRLAELLAQQAEAQQAVAALRQTLEKIKQQAPPPAAEVVAVEEEPEVGDYHVCVRGNVHELGDIVPRGFLDEVELTGQFAIPQNTSGRRELAEWIASGQNPLTARVMVNRIWHHLFGRGIVPTVDNFGLTGELPTHPELLDYLAQRFVDEGWSVKRLVREIVLSHTWQLASEAPATLVVADPGNRLFGRQNRRRLEAEVLYDTMLRLSGTLDLTVGGNTVRKGTGNEIGYKFDYARRAVYFPIFRNQIPEPLAMFDFANPNHTEGRRNDSTVAPQALYLLNSPLVELHARRTAELLLADQGTDDHQRIEQLYLQALGRHPSEAELVLTTQYVSVDDQAQRLERWTDLCQSVFGCLDFRYLD
jgi:hypothetical protein